MGTWADAICIHHSIPIHFIHSFHSHSFSFYHSFDTISFLLLPLGFSSFVSLSPGSGSCLPGQIIYGTCTHLTAYTVLSLMLHACTLLSAAATGFFFRSSAAATKHHRFRFCLPPGFCLLHACLLWIPALDTGFKSCLLFYIYAILVAASPSAAWCHYTSCLCHHDSRFVPACSLCSLFCPLTGCHAQPALCPLIAWTGFIAGHTKLCLLLGGFLLPYIGQCYMVINIWILYNILSVFIYSFAGLGSALGSGFTSGFCQVGGFLPATAWVPLFLGEF